MRKPRKEAARGEALYIESRGHIDGRTSVPSNDRESVSITLSSAQAMIMSDSLKDAIKLLIDGHEEVVIVGSESSAKNKEGQLRFEWSIITQVNANLRQQMKDEKHIASIKSTIPLILAAGDDIPLEGTDKSDTGVKTRDDVFREPILRALIRLGGSGKVREVMSVVFNEVNPILGNADFSLVANDEPRWRNAARWCASFMKKDGLIIQGQPRGTWHITKKGKKLIEK